MLNNHELLKLYNAEKAALEFPSEPMLPFKQWKKEYIHSMRGCFQGAKKAELAVAEADVIVTEAEKELSAKIQKPKKEKKTTQAVVKPVAKKEVPVNENGANKKTAIAEKIYREMMVDGVHPKRADVIKRFMSEVGLTQAGASTYQYNIKKKLTA